MTGRQLFSLAQPLCSLLALVFRILPRPLVQWTWHLTNVWPAEIGALLRYALALRMGARLGNNVFFGAFVHVDGLEHLKTGANVTFHRGCYIDARGGITLGDNVSVAHGCSLISFEHSFDPVDPKPIKYQPLKYRSIVIADDVWVGAGVKILAGTRLGARSVIAAGAVARGEMIGGKVWGGVPVRALREISVQAVSET